MRAVSDYNDHELERLVDAVLDQCGFDDVEEAGDTLHDVAHHGAAGGFNGFIYYGDTVEFYHLNRDVILPILERDAENLGTNPIDLVAGFQCVDDDIDNTVIGKSLYGSDADESWQVANCLAWWALERAAEAVEGEEVGLDD